MLFSQDILLDKLLDNLCQLNKFFEEGDLKYLGIWHRQARNIRMFTAEESYQFLLKTQPDLINRVPVRDLASYLHMRRETLSRMRGRMH